MTSGLLIAAPLRRRRIWAVAGSAVTVCAFLGCGDGGSPTQPERSNATATTAARQATSFRFVKAPVVVYYAKPGYPAQWTIVVRLNKVLPRRSNRRPRGDLLTDGNPSEAGLSRVGSRKGRACYVTSYGSENDVHGSPHLVKPRDGQRVTITLYFNKRTLPVDIRVAARRKATLPEVNTFEGVQPYLAQLGCL
jgi:hypothetical protein